MNTHNSGLARPLVAAVTALVKPSAAVFSVLALAVPTALASPGGDGHGFSFGKPGDAADVERTIRITAKDVAYVPSHISVTAGETVRFVVENAGNAPHEFTIGPASVQEAHRAEMAEMMAGDGHGHGDGHGSESASTDHDDPNAVMLRPGETGEIVWTFGNASNIEFGCNVPGHYEAGMRGDIDIVDASSGEGHETDSH